MILRSRQLSSLSQGVLAKFRVSWPQIELAPEQYFLVGDCVSPQSYEEFISGSWLLFRYSPKKGLAKIDGNFDLALIVESEARKYQVFSQEWVYDCFGELEAIHDRHPFFIAVDSIEEGEILALELSLMKLRQERKEVWSKADFLPKIVGFLEPAAKIYHRLAFRFAIINGTAKPVEDPVTCELVVNYCLPC